MFMSVQNKPTQARPQTKLELAEAKLLKIKDNTKLMLEGKKSAQLKMEELKLKIVEESKARKEKIRKADHQLNSNKTALKSVQANIKKIKQEADFVPTRGSKRALIRRLANKVSRRLINREIVDEAPIQARQPRKLVLAKAKLSKIKENTKLMLQNKSNAQRKMEALKLQIAEESKAMKEEIRKADQRLKANKVALKSVQASIKQIKESSAAAIKEESVVSFSQFYAEAMKV